MSCVGYSSSKRTCHTHALEVTGDFFVVLMDLCEKQTGFFVIHQIEDCARIGRPYCGICWNACCNVRRRGSRKANCPNVRVCRRIMALQGEQCKCGSNS